MFKHVLRELKYICKERLFQIVLIILVIIIGLYLYNEHVNTDYARSKDTRMRMAVIKNLGGPCLPIIAQCCTSRNISEGIYARRSDIPGGFCFHSDCDVVHIGKLYAEKEYRIKVIKKNREKNPDSLQPWR